MLTTNRLVFVKVFDPHAHTHTNCHHQPSIRFGFAVLARITCVHTHKPHAGWFVANNHPLYKPLREFNWNRLKKAFNCFVDFGSSETPTDYSFIYSYTSYAPLSVRVRHIFFKLFMHSCLTYVFGFVFKATNKHTKAIANLNITRMELAEAGGGCSTVIHDLS
jgi:hypothetical protein